MKRYFVIIGLLMGMILPSEAQKMTLGFLYPAGGQQGTTIDMEVGGLNLQKATSVLFSGNGIKGEIIPYEAKEAVKKKGKKLNDQSSPQLADRVTVRVTIDPDVCPGLYDFRLQSPQSISNKLFFEVSSYTNFLESGQSSMDRPDVVPALPAVICGQVTPGGVDCFRFEGKAGADLVISVKGRTLVPYIADAVPGWFQPVIRLVDSKGREIAYCDDYRHWVDPVIMTTLPSDDVYLLTIHDAIYRGREDFNYRIQIGEIPFCTGIYPPYGVAGKKTKIKVKGMNLATDHDSFKSAQEGYVGYMAEGGNGRPSNPVSFYSVPKEWKTVAFPENGSTLEKGMAVIDSLTSDCRIKRYVIQAQKNENLVVELIGRRNGSKIDAVMRLKDRGGNVVQTVDDTEDPLQGMMTFHADPLVKFHFKKDARYILEIEDVQGGFGEDYHYLLLRHSDIAAFNVFVSPANIQIPAGGTAAFHVNIMGKAELPMKLEVDGLPAACRLSATEMKNAKMWDVSITAPPGMDLQRFPLKVKAVSTKKDKSTSKEAVAVDDMMQAFYYTHHIPAASFMGEIVHPSPYCIRIDGITDKDGTFQINGSDSILSLKVIVDKNADFRDTIGFELGKRTKLFTLEPVSLLPGETEKTLNVKINRRSLEAAMNTKQGKSAHSEKNGNGKQQTPVNRSSYYQLCIVGTVKGEIIKQGKRTFQNAKYREQSPYFSLEVRKP